MVQTRSQKKIIETKEKKAVETLLSLSEMDFTEPEPEDTLISLPRINHNLLKRYTQSEIDDARTQMARKHCHDEMNRVDLPMPELVKYCPYTGTFEQQLEKSKAENDMNVYNALITFRDNMNNYDNTYNYLKNNFDYIKNNFTDEEVLDYFKVKNKLKNYKTQVNHLKRIKSLKESLEKKKLDYENLSKEISKLEIEFEKQKELFKKKYN